MPVCNAGKGCAINCPGACVAYWDHDTGVCHKQCIRGKAQPLKIGTGPFNISIGSVSGPNVAMLLLEMVPPDLSEALRAHEGPITLQLMDTTAAGLVAELFEQMGGMLA